jgi:hypothetical protein
MMNTEKIAAMEAAARQAVLDQADQEAQAIMAQAQRETSAILAAAKKRADALRQAARVRAAEMELAAGTVAAPRSVTFVTGHRSPSGMYFDCGSEFRQTVVVDMTTRTVISAGGDRFPESTGSAVDKRWERLCEREHATLQVGEVLDRNDPVWALALGL